MHHLEELAGLSRRQGALFCEERSATELAEQFDTPLYVYSRAALTRAIADWKAGIAGTQHRVFYAMKANASLALLQEFLRAGFGFDIVSGGELARALAIGAKGCDIVYSGVGKTATEIEAALKADVHCFNVESVPELHRISAVATAMGKTARVSLRVNPDVDAKTHPYISTGLKFNKFGVAFDQAVQAYALAAQLPGICITGIDCHIGSQITELDPFVHAAEKVLDLLESILAQGHKIDHIDFGGGLGVTYAQETPPKAAALIAALSEAVARRGLSHLALYFEPGRSLVANCGTLLTRVQFVKHTPSKNFCIVDAAMNDMIRPTLYQADMAIVNCDKGHGQSQTYDVVGPVCETGDFLAKERVLTVSEGDTLAMLGAGAYGMSMASNYNQRFRPAEVLVDGAHVWLIRRRETLADLMALESSVPAIEHTVV